MRIWEYFCCVLAIRRGGSNFRSRLFHDVGIKIDLDVCAIFRNFADAGPKARTPKQNEPTFALIH